MPRRSVSNDASRSGAPANSQRDPTPRLGGVDSAVSGRRDVPHPSNPVCSCGAPRSGGREWRSERASGWRRPRSARRPRVLGVRPANGARSCGCRADRRRSGRLRRGARERRRGRRPHRVRVVSNWVASITNTEGPWPRRNSRQASWIGSPAAPQSARPDSFRTCSRWRGASDCARWRPGMALWSVCAGGTEPARGAPSSQRGRCGRSLTAPAHQLQRGSASTWRAYRSRRGIGQLGGLTEGEAAGHAFRDAGGLQPGIHAIHAVVALDHLAGDRVPLWRAPRAGGDAALAADAGGGLDVDDAVLLALAHGAGRTGPHAPRVLAVEARHEGEVHARLPVDVDGTGGDDLARVRSGAEVLVGLAVHFTGQAADAAGLVVEKDVGAHGFPPLVGAGFTRTSVSVRAQPPPAGSKS